MAAPVFHAVLLEHHGTMGSLFERLWAKLFGGTADEAAPEERASVKRIEPPVANAFVEQAPAMESESAVAVLEDAADDTGVAVEPAEPSLNDASGAHSVAHEPWWCIDGLGETSLVAPERPELQGVARAMENILVNQMDGHDLGMPPLPEVAERVMRELRSREYRVDKVAQTIGEDPVISAAVLRMSNSPIYGGVSKITTLKSAVARIGASALKTLMMHQSLRAAIFRKDGEDWQLGKLVWDRAVAGAHVMRGLCRFTHMDEEEAFLIGLMHDIGNIIVLREVQKQEAMLQYVIDVPTFDYLCYECHQEFGELIAESWKLPDELQSLIANHHSEPHEEDPLRVQRSQLQLTDMILSLLEFTPRHDYNLLRTTSAQELGLATSESFMLYLDRLPEELTSAMGSF